MSCAYGKCTGNHASCRCAVLDAKMGASRHWHRLGICFVRHRMKRWPREVALDKTTLRTLHRKAAGFIFGTQNVLLWCTKEYKVHINLMQRATCGTRSIYIRSDNGATQEKTELEQKTGDVVHRKIDGTSFHNHRESLYEPLLMLMGWTAINVAPFECPLTFTSSR